MPGFPIAMETARSVPHLLDVIAEDCAAAGLL
jgi:hypothetical protein